MNLHWISAHNLKHLFVRKPIVTFRSLHRSALQKADALHFLLEDKRMDYCDAVPLLWSAWYDLSKSVALFHRVGASTETQQMYRNIFAEDGYLATVLGKEVTQYEWLNIANDKYYTLQKVEVTRNQCDVTLDALNEGLRITKKWFVARHSSLLRRGIRLGAIAAQIAFFAAALGGVGYGAYEYTTRSKESDGLSATYFSNPNFEGFPFMWVDSNIDFNWPTAPPFKTIPRKTFSAQWEGCIHVDETPMRLEMITTATPLTITIDGHELSQKVIASKEKMKRNTAPLKKAVAPPKPSIQKILFPKALSPGNHQIKIAFPVIRVPSIFNLRWKRYHHRSRPVPSKFLVPLGGNDRYPCKQHTQSPKGIKTP